MRLSILFRIHLIVGLIILLNCQPLKAQKDVNSIYQAGIQAYQNGEFDQYLSSFETLIKLRPYHPIILQRLAVAYYLNEKPKKALSCLQQLILIKADTTFLQDKDIKAKASVNDVSTLKALIIEQNKPVIKSQLAYELPEKDLHPEGIAYNPSNNTFYIGSIHKRKIIAISPTGKLHTILQYPNDSLTAVSGLQYFDGNLWATIVATPHMINFDSARLEQSALIQIDLEKKIIQNVYLAEDDLNHWFGDLNVHPNGDIYVSDSRQPTVYRLKKGAQKLEPWLSSELFRSLQGLCFSPDGKYVFLADYANGLFVVNAETKKMHAELLATKNVVAKGIDGLYYYKNSLIGIQNGVFPKRITQFFLDASFREITHHKILERSNPLLDEPTLGVIVNNRFIYIANSPWNHYDKDNKLKVKELEDVKILQLKLE